MGGKSGFREEGRRGRGPRLVCHPAGDIFSPGVSAIRITKVIVVVVVVVVVVC